MTGDQPYIPRTPELDESFLSVYREYAGGEPLGIWNYLTMRAEYDIAAAFSKLFWPDFVEVGGCVLLKERYSPDSFMHWQKVLQGNRESIESIINHVHVIDLFLNCDAVLSHDLQATTLEVDSGRSRFGIYPVALLDYLGKVLLVCWKHALLEAFPGKRFTFHYTKDDEESAPEITFHQVESGAEPLGTV